VERALGHLRGLAKPIKDIEEDDFERIMRINALRWVAIVQADDSVFIAIKYASAAMAKLCPEKGKTIPGGSIILTASGMLRSNLANHSGWDESKCWAHCIFRIESCGSVHGPDIIVRVDRTKHTGQCYMSGSNTGGWDDHAS
jgi:hypothetical protein